MDSIIEAVALESGLPLNKVDSTAAVLDDDKTIPFIDRYRKEVTGESVLAAQEFPDLDVSERSAISIARRIQDPLAELVKIDPQR